MKAFICDFYHVCFKGETCRAVKTSALSQNHKAFSQVSKITKQWGMSAVVYIHSELFYAT